MNIFIENETKEYFNFRGYKKLIETTIETVAEVKNIPEDLEVNVLIVEPETIKAINSENRGIDSVTDVLSFPYFDFDTPGNMDAIDDESDEVILGDIILCADRVVSQAKEFGHSQKRELAYLTVHSMLHLIGFDHMTEQDEKQMTAQADVIMDKLGISR